MNPTPTPWNIQFEKVGKKITAISIVAEQTIDGAYRYLVANMFSTENQKENAQLIVRAVNAYEELTHALTIALVDHQKVDPHHHDLCQICCLLNHALAKEKDL